MSRDALGRHVVGGTDECVGIALGAEFAADAKVAEFDLPIAAEEDVGGFDICEKGSVCFERKGTDMGTSVDDLLTVKISQTIQDTFCNFPQYFFTGSTAEFLDFFVDTIKTTTFAVFHGYRY